jgi:hypothetical protein
MQIAKTLATASFLATMTTVAFAGTFAGTCTSEPQAKWLKADAVEAKATAAGYTVAKSKVAGTCYEIYASKGSQRFELFYNPMTAEIVETVTK